MNVGQQLSHYMLEEVIGTGGFGDVFRARDLESGLEIAIKCSHIIEADKRKETEQRFMREISCTKRVNHPRIVQLYDYGSLPDGTLYLVMEYVKGITLEKKIKEEKKLPYLMASDIVLQILGALSEAHNQGLVHRDLKPSNIMLTRQSNNNLLVKLLDFGIAKAFDGTEPDLTRQQFENGAGFGTPQYMPPEQFFGKQLGPHSDLYALGLVFYEMLTGKQAFSGKNLTEIIQKQIREFPIIPAPFNQGPLNDIFQKALAKSISARYESAVEMYSDLDGIVRHRSPFLALYCQTEKKVPTVSDDCNQTLPLQQPLMFQSPSIDKTLCTPQKTVSNDGMSGFSTIVYEKTSLNSMAEQKQPSQSSLNLESIKTEENTCINGQPLNPSLHLPSAQRPVNITRPSSSVSQLLMQPHPSIAQATIPFSKPPIIPRPSASVSQVLMQMSQPETVISKIPEPSPQSSQPVTQPSPSSQPQPFFPLSNITPEEYDEIEGSATILQPLAEAQSLVSLSDGGADDSDEMDIATKAVVPAVPMPSYLQEDTESEKITGAFYQQATQYNIETNLVSDDLNASGGGSFFSNIQKSKGYQSFISSPIGRVLVETKEDITDFIDTLYESHFTSLVIAVCLAIGIVSLVIILLLL